MSDRSIKNINNAAKQTTVTIARKWAMVAFLFAYLASSLVGGFVYNIPQAQAAIPKYINFQGKLTIATAGANQGSNVADGNYAFQFKLYDALTSGTLLWTETYDQASGACTKLSVTNGVFNTKLGTCNSLAGVDFTTGSLYLTVNFAPTGTSYDGEMSPRKQLVSSAYAFVANSVSGDGVVNNAIQSATALTTGRTSANPALQVDTNTASSVTGLKVTSAAAAGGLALTVISSGTNENLTLDAKGSGTISINGAATGDILLGGGSGATGCTVTNSNGNFTCTGSITGAATGTFGYFSRTGTTITPATSGDILSFPGAGTSSEKFGAGASAAGNYSSVFGNGATSAGTNSVALGYNSTTPYTNSVAIGYGANIINVAGYSTGSAVAIGYNASADAANVALGASSVASGYSNVALGAGASAIGIYHSVAVGYGAHADLNDATTLGFAADAKGAAGTAIGSGATGAGYSIVIGQGASAGNSTSNLFNVAIGQAASISSSYSGTVVIGEQATATASSQLVIGSSSYPINDAYFGKGAVNASPTAYTLNGTGGSGTNIVGGALQLAGGKGTGNAAGGDIIFQTSTAGSSGSTLQSLATKMTIQGSTGNVGIGSASPSTLLYVEKNVGSSVMATFYNKDTSPNPVTFAFKNDYSGIGNTSKLIGNQNFGNTSGAGRYWLELTDGTASGINTAINADGSSKSVAIFGGPTIYSNWIDMPTSTFSGIGDGGVGANAWIARAAASSQFLSGSVAGDIIYRNTSNSLLFGNSGTEIASFAIGSNQPLFQATSASKIPLRVKGFASQSSNLQEWQNSSGTALALINASGDLTVQPSVRTTGSPTLLTVTGPAHTTLTASTEASDINFNLARTVQFATGALTTQRALLVQAPSYGFAGASTLTDAATVAITGAPKSQTNATITNSHGLLIQAGAVQPAGAVTNAYGLTVNTPTGATNNYAAAFLGGNVGIGTASPGVPLQVQGAAVINGAGTNGIGLTVGSTSGSGGLQLTRNTTYFGIQSYESLPLVLNGAGNNVGIGNTNPLYLLSLGANSKGFSQYSSSSSNDAVKAVSSSAGANFGVQNVNASGYSGIEYIDNAGSVAVFTGYNNGNAGEFRFNNIATSGFITFKIASSDKLTIANSGNVGVGTTGPSSLFSVGSSSQFQVNSSGAIAAATGIASSGTINFSGLTASSAVYTDGSKNLTSTAPTSGSIGYWSRSGTTLQPTTSNDILSIPTTNTTGADLAITNTGVYTGTGILNLTANSATTGTLGLFTSSSLSSGNLLSLTSNGTAALTGQTGLNVAIQGTNGTSAQTTYGAQISNTHAGTTSTNVGLSVTASGGTTANYAALFNGGYVGVGTSAPSIPFQVSNNTGVAYMGVQDTRASGKFSVLTAGTAGSGFQYDGTGYFALYAASGLTDSGATTGKIGLKIFGSDNNILIGNNTYNTADSNYKLDITHSGSTGTLRVYDQTATTGSTRIFVQEGAGQSTSEVFGVYANNGTTPRLVVQNSNIGIGTAAPGAKLDLKDGSMYFSNTNVSQPISSIWPATTYLAVSPLSGTDGGANFVGLSDTDATAMTIGGIIGTTTPSTTTPAVVFAASKTLNSTSSANLGNTDTAFQFRNQNTNIITVLGSGNLGLGDTTPAALLTVGSGDLFQVNSSGAIAAATGITSSGTINFSGLSSNGAVYTSGGTGTLTTTAPTSGAIGYLSRTGTTLQPTTANDVLSIPTTNTTGADLAITNTGVYTGSGIANLTANSATTGTLGVINGNGLSSGTLLSLSSNGTAALTNQTGLNISLQGTNGTSAQTTYGAQISNTHAGTTSTNVGLNVTVANGTTANYAALFNGGNVGIGTSTPGTRLTLGSGQFSVPVGSAGTPSMTFTGDTSSGFYSVAGGTISYAAAGTPIVLFSANTGVGGFPKAVRLSSTTVLGFSSGNPDANTDDTTLSRGSAGNIYVGTTPGGSSGTLIAGNIGIGATGPTAKLAIGGSATQTAWGLNGVQIQAAAATYTDSSTASSGTATNAMFNTFGQPTLAATNTSVTTTNAATLYIAGPPIAGTNQTITNAASLVVATGNVGIGTAAPGQKLEVAGNALLNPTGSAYLNVGTTFSFSGYSGMGGGMGSNIYYDGTNWRYRTSNYGALVWGGASGEIGFYTAPSGTSGNVASITSRMFFSNAGGLNLGTSTSDVGAGNLAVSGNIAVGTLSASAKLHVLSTTEQQRLGYDASNYFKTTVDSSGNTVFALTGTSPAFTFSQDILLGGLIKKTSAATTVSYNFNNAAGLGFPSLDITYPGTGRYIAGEVSVYGTNDIFFQAVPATTSGNAVFEGYNSGGVVISTGGNTSPIKFDVNRTEVARFTSGGVLRVADLATGLTAPTTSGTTKMVITDANGDLSFTTIPGGGAPVWSSITAPTGNLSLAHGANTTAFTFNSVTTATAFDLSSTSLTTGSILNLASNGTAALTGQTGLNISIQGTNAASAQTTYGAQISNTHAGTTSTNVGLNVTVANGTTANYAALFNGGSVGINNTAPGRKLDVLDTANPQLRLSYTAGSVYTDLQTTSAGNLYINPSGGNVGIGTTAPGAALGIQGGTSSDEFRLGDINAGYYYKIGRNTSTGLLDFTGTQSGFRGYTFNNPDNKFYVDNASGNSRITSSTGTSAALAGIALYNSSRAYNWYIDNRGTYDSPTAPNDRLSFFNNAGAEKLTVLDGGNVGIGNFNPATLLSVGTNFGVSSLGDVTSAFTTLNGSTTANGAGTNSTTLILTSATNFDVGNYVQVSSTNCVTGVNVCYAKITAITTNTLTITPAISWANASAVVEVHVPEIGGVDLTQALTNRYGRGYFIDGIVTGNGSTYYSDSSLAQSISSSTFNLLNNGNTATINLGGSTTNVGVLGNLGVGTTAPTQKLQIVDGSALVSTSSTFAPTTMSAGFDAGAYNVNSVVVSGKYMYVAKDGSDTATCSGTTVTGCELSIFDISSPNTVRAIVGLNFAANIKTMAVKGEYIYFGSGAQWYVYKFSGGAAPTYVTTYGTTGNVTSLSINGDNLVIGTDGGSATLYLYNISTLSNPIYTNSTAMGSPIGTVLAKDDYIYVGLNAVAGTCSGTTVTGCELRIYNYSLSAIRGIDTTIDVNSIDVSGRYAYLGLASASGNDFRIYDVNDPVNTAPTVTGGLDLSTGVITLKVIGNTVYAGLVSASGNDFRIFNVTDPTAPTNAGGVDTGVDVRTLALSGAYIYTGNAQGTGNDVKIYYHSAGVDTPRLSADNGVIANLQVTQYGNFMNGLTSSSLNVGSGGISSTGTVSATTLSGNAINLNSQDMGTYAAGPVLTVGYNTNAGPGAGSVNFQSEYGTAGYVWQDAAGNLEIGTSAPGYFGDTGGTVIGTQTSTRSTKQDITDYTDIAGALQKVTSAPLHTFRYIKEVQGYGTNNPLAKTRIGFIADEVPGEFMWGGSIDQVSVNGLLMGAIQQLNKITVQYAANGNVGIGLAEGEIANEKLVVNGNAIIKGNLVTQGTVTAHEFVTDGNADVAENYTTTDTTLVASELVSIDQIGQSKVKRTGILENAIGVVSSNPGITLGGDTAGTSGNSGVKNVPVALAGRVPVKVTNENGPIVAGDFLTSSATIPGAAMKATKAGPIIGQALENYSASTTGSLTGTVMVFVKSTSYNGVAIEKQISGLTFDFTSDTTVADSADQILSNLLAQLPNLDPSKLSQINTDVVVANGAVITPYLTTHALRTDFLSAVTQDGGLEIASTTIFKGGLQVDQIKSITDLISFNSDVEFFGTPYFTTDTAGFALVKAGVQTVDVKFTREYLAQPIVNASYSFEQSTDTSTVTDPEALAALQAAQVAQAQTFLAEGVTFAITNKTKNGFTIVLNKPATSDVKFSWTAFAVRNATTFMSLDAPAAPSPQAQAPTVPSNGSVAGDTTSTTPPTDNTQPST